MKKIIVFFFVFLLPLQIYALDYPKLNSKYVEVYDLTDDKVLYEKSSNNKTSIASLTKIATTITAIETIDNLNEKLTITKEILDTVAWEASKAGLKAGDKVTYMDLLYASMLPSGADATNSIAILSSGSVEKYVKKMNDLAKKIGLENTNFENVTGLDLKNHYSTASDIRKLLVYSLKNETFKKIYTMKEYKLTNGLVVKSTLLESYSNAKVKTDKIIGSKTGFTENAGYCLSSLSKAGNHELIIIVINAERIKYDYYNIIDTIKLIDFVNNNYKEEVLIKKNDIIKELPVYLSDSETYNIKAKDDITKFLPKDYDKQLFKVDYVGIKKLSYKNKAGQVLGKIKYYYDDKMFYEQEIVLEEEIICNWNKWLDTYYLYIFTGEIVLLLIIVAAIIRKKKKLKMV